MPGVRKTESWSELASLVDALLDAPPADRAALVEKLSAGDPVRRSTLESLLSECEQESALLSRSAADIFAALFEDEVVQFPPALAKRYQMTSELGQGGMSTVYLARDVKHGRDVAVKVVHPRLTSALGADRFLREIAIVAQLQHPHIVPLYDSGEADGSLYYVMPYEAGLSLRGRLARDGPFAPEDVVLILRDVCDALAHAHERGIVHRDIKPDNVLLSGRHAMVADFGVAKAANDAATGIALGTPAYMAPEQIEANPNIDHRADIYSVGVLGYELLSGRPPFEGDREEIVSGHLSKTPTPITTLRPEVPVTLAELVMKCLEKDPDDRWQSADEVLRRLDDLASSRSGRFASSMPARRRWRSIGVAAVAIVLLIISAVFERRATMAASWQNRWNDARIERLTDFPGSEVDAAISNDGQHVAFLADRDSVFDAFSTRVGSGQFANLTGGKLPQLFNEDVRNIGFTPDGAHVWMRVADITSAPNAFLVPTPGGAAEPFIKRGVMVVWSPDGSKIAYHETTPGDPIFVTDSAGKNPRRSFIAVPGVHNHYLAWSPDGRLIYFSHGLPPDEMDIWRVPSSGGQAERITSHHSRVSYPVLLDANTLLYSAIADDGTGPWLYLMDLSDRVARRVTEGVEHYISIAAAAEKAGQSRRLVAAVSNPTVQLWSAPITTDIAGESSAVRITLPTARAAAPRFGRDTSLWYMASRSGADGLWRLSGGKANELWKSNQGAVVGAAAVSPDGKTVCFPVRRHGRSTLYCMAADGTRARAVAESLDVRGAASWSPDGRWIAVAAEEGKGARLFKVPVGGGSPVRLVDSVSSNPAWSPDGRFILYSGTPRARNAPVKAVTPDGKPFPFPQLSVDRDGDSYRFLPDGSQLVVKQGGFRRQGFWLLDLASGARRQLTRLKPGESLQRFDVSPDGKRVVFERVWENSDIVLIELP
jgi:Tol biopolymer transport system component